MSFKWSVFKCLNFFSTLNEENHVDHFGLGVAPFCLLSIKIQGMKTAVINDFLMSAVVVVNFTQGAWTKTRNMKSFAEVAVKGRHAAEYTKHDL